MLKKLNILKYQKILTSLFEEAQLLDKNIQSQTKDSLKFEYKFKHA